MYIKDDDHLTRVTNIVDRLLVCAPPLTKKDETGSYWDRWYTSALGWHLDFLSDKIEEYEDVHYPIDDVNDHQS